MAEEATDEEVWAWLRFVSGARFAGARERARALLTRRAGALAGYANLAVRSAYEDALCVVGVDVASLPGQVVDALSADFFGRRLGELGLAELKDRAPLVARLLAAAGEEACAAAFEAFDAVFCVHESAQRDVALVATGVYELAGPADAEDPRARRLAKHGLALALRLKWEPTRDLAPASQLIVDRLKRFAGHSGLLAWASEQLAGLRELQRLREERRAAKHARQ